MIAQSEAVQRVQSVMDSEVVPIIADRACTDYVAFCILLSDMAEYAASKSWNFTDEAEVAATIARARLA